MKLYIMLGILCLALTPWTPKHYQKAVLVPMIYGPRHQHGIDLLRSLKPRLLMHPDTVDARQRGPPAENFLNTSRSLNTARAVTIHISTSFGFAKTFRRHGG